MTYSIVAVDRNRGELGVAVQSKFLAVGAVVPWAVAGVGAIATQALADVTIGPRGLELLAKRTAVSACKELLLAGDELREQRQFGLVSADGDAASFTGTDCFAHASSIVGEGFAAQGNILAGREVVEALAAGFAGSAEETLATRLLEALRAAQAAGGDRRGQQSAALLVVRAGGGYGGNHDRMIDLRVDDHATPIAELQRLLGLHALYFGKPDPAALVAIDELLRRELSSFLDASGFASSPSFGDALYAFVSHENLEERWVDAHHLDPAVLAYFRAQLSKRGS